MAGEFICAAFQCQAGLVCSPNGTTAAWIDGFDCIEGQRCRYRGGSVASARSQWLLPLTWASIGVLERRSADQSQQCPVTAATAPPAVDRNSRTANSSNAGHAEATLNGINRDDLEPILCQSSFIITGKSIVSRGEPPAPPWGSKGKIPLLQFTVYISNSIL